MAGYGAAFISPAWSYPSAVVAPDETLAMNCTFWMSIAFTLLVPPLVTGAMPDENPYPVFFFFAICGTVGFIHAYTTAKDTDGKNFYEIIKSFE